MARDTSVSQSELEKKVASMYTPDDPDATVEATCSGDRDAEVGASQDCHLEIGDQAANVRAAVTSVHGNDIEFDATPFVPGRGSPRRSSARWRTRASRSFRSTARTSSSVVKESVTCSAQPADRDGTVTATVTSVDGLLVTFDYAVVG